MKEAIILCGGRNLRMQGYSKLPKGLLPYKGKALIDRQVAHLEKHGYERIILACGYKWQMFKDHFRKNKQIILSIERKKLGTSGALKQAMKKMQNEQCLVLNGDDLMSGLGVKDLDIGELERIGPNLIVVVPLRSPYGIVEFCNGNIKSFKEKPILPYWINAGWYLLKKDIPLVEKGDLEREVFPAIGMKAYKYEGPWRTFNNVKDFEENS